MNFAFLLETSSGGADLSSLWSIGGIVVLIVFFYFFMIRPQKKRDKEDAAMRDALQVGDEVTTIGGIIGKVISIKGETFVLETTREKTQIRFLKGAIRTIDVKVAEVAAAVAEAKESEASAEAEAPADKDASAK
jgi:preprotein translocase subunit YajC